MKLKKDQIFGKNGQAGTFRSEEVGHLPDI
jgi:hypothetical protein